MKLKIKILLLLMTAMFSVPLFAADPTFTLDMSIDIPDKLNFSTWLKQMGPGETDPGKQGTFLKHVTTLDFEELTWSTADGRWKSKYWYTIFIGIDCNNLNGYQLSVSAVDVKGEDYGDKISESILVTKDFIPQDMWLGSDGTSLYPQDPAPAIAPPSNQAGRDALFKLKTRSLKTIVENGGFDDYIFKESGPKNRIYRCYVSIFDFRDPNSPDINNYVTTKAMLSLGKPLTKARPDQYNTGSITFTVTTL